MARYTHLLTVSQAETSDLHHSIVKTLENCGLNLVYAQGDYFVAKEKPGQVSLSQLTTIEVIISPPNQDFQRTKLNLVVKNEELPLQPDNHCQRVFEVVSQAIGSMV